MNVSRRFHTHKHAHREQFRNAKLNRLKEVLMVNSGKQRHNEDMERLNPLHNFELPCLKWGNQKVLRCMKVDSNGDVSAVDRNQSSDSGTRRRHFEFDNIRFRSSDFFKFSSSEKMKARIGAAGDSEIEATREKLMFDFRKDLGKMKDAILRESFPPTPTAVAISTTSYCSPVERPWNLRTRRAACSPANGNGEVLKPNSSPVRIECKNPRIRPAIATTSGEKRERPKFSVSVSRHEMEEDFMSMAGRRLPRKPKKRPRIVQKQLDTLFPGLWLSEITADLYKVPDEVDTGKR